MSLQCGLVGLPNAGKSTLFNALTALRAPVEKYPFSTVDPNVGVVTLKDRRLEQAAAVAGCRQVTHSWVRFVDIAGLVAGASRGEGLGNRFLAHIREMDALIHVVRGFAAADVPHPLGQVDPLRDIELIHTELYLADLETVDRQLAKSSRQAKGGGRGEQATLAQLEELRGFLAAGQPPVTGEALQAARSLQLLSCKPRLYVLNVGEGGEAPGAWPGLARLAAAEGAPLVVMAAALEDELIRLPEAEQAELRHAYGLTEEGLEHLVREAYALLNLITFFTVKGEEARAWTVEAGTTARRGAGKVHSDMEKGFIKAEVVPWDQLVGAGSLARAREKGQVRLEGREYPLQDGDVVLFHFR
jgi:ribosome-binding ATPase